MTFIKSVSILSLIFLLMLCLAMQAPGAEDELSLYNASGEATAYIADDATIYLWSGKPVAYLKGTIHRGFHVYGFNGRHLGWLVDGVIRDHAGKAAGAVAEVFTAPTAAEPFRGYREYKPLRALRETAPSRPDFTDTWSDMDFKSFLMQGASEE